MKTTKSIAISAAFAMMATTALSQTTQDDVMKLLTDAGYTDIEVQSTLFGNTKFEANGPEGEREIVLGKDGSILQDYTETNSGTADNDNDNDNTNDNDVDDVDDENETDDDNDVDDKDDD